MVWRVPVRTRENFERSPLGGLHAALLGCSQQARVEGELQEYDIAVQTAAIPEEKSGVRGAGAHRLYYQNDV